ncbi:MAG TPA: transposase [Anaeromyxobacteraceae bacterium]|nr:transposase [Anaeromyxobacteraceae bacterium]
MPRPHPPEFRQRAVELARLREKPIVKIAEDLGIAESCLRNWMKQADIDDGARAGLNTDERAELVRLRRELRVAKWRSRS